MTTTEYQIGDIVEQNGKVLLLVVGYIHDQERLFVVDPTGVLNHGNEFELWFGEVTRQWRELPNVD